MSCNAIVTCKRWINQMSQTLFSICILLILGSSVIYKGPVCSRLQKKKWFLELIEISGSCFLFVCHTENPFFKTNHLTKQLSGKTTQNILYETDFRFFSKAVTNSQPITFKSDYFVLKKWFFLDKLQKAISNYTSVSDKLIKSVISKLLITKIQQQFKQEIEYIGLPHQTPPRLRVEWIQSHQHLHRTYKKQKSHNQNHLRSKNHLSA